MDGQHTCNEQFHSPHHALRRVIALRVHHQSLPVSIVAVINRGCRRTMSASIGVLHHTLLSSSIVIDYNC